MDPRLAVFVIWEPKHGGTERDATDAEGLVPDPRATQWWDASGATMTLFAHALALHQDAWDVYLVYPPGARWDGGDPPPPAFWMHQLGGDAPPDKILDGAALERAVESLSSPAAATPDPPAPLPSAAP